MVFIYVSGKGTDSTEKGRAMWARVKGRTENALQRLPFKGVYLFRPGIIQPLHGIRSKTKAYRIFYVLSAPLLPLVRRRHAPFHYDDRGAGKKDAGRRQTWRARSPFWR